MAAVQRAEEADNNRMAAVQRAEEADNNRMAAVQRAEEAEYRLQEAKQRASQAEQREAASADQALNELASAKKTADQALNELASAKKNADNALNELASAKKNADNALNELATAKENAKQMKKDLATAEENAKNAERRAEEAEKKRAAAEERAEEAEGNRAAAVQRAEEAEGNRAAAEERASQAEQRTGFEQSLNQDLRATLHDLQQQQQLFGETIRKKAFEIWSKTLDIRAQAEDHMNAMAYLEKLEAYLVENKMKREVFSDELANESESEDESLIPPILKRFYDQENKLADGAREVIRAARKSIRAREVMREVMDYADNEVEYSTKNGKRRKTIDRRPLGSLQPLALGEGARYNSTHK
jgi:hypothetical protein